MDAVLKADGVILVEDSLAELAASTEKYEKDVSPEAIVFLRYLLATEPWYDYRLNSFGTSAPSNCMLASPLEFQQPAHSKGMSATSMVGRRPPKCKKLGK